MNPETRMPISYPLSGAVNKSLSGLVLGIFALFCVSCSQAGHPSASGQALSSGAASTASSSTTTSGGVTSSTVTALITAGSKLSSKFPGMARLQLSITGPAGAASLPQQTNLPLNGQSIPLTLPSGVPLTLKFDVFDATGTYIGSGTSVTTLNTSSNPVISVNILPLAAGTAYVDPVTGLTGSGPILALSVSVTTAASQQPISGATVSLGAGGTVTATTNASGIASFTSVPTGTDVHIFNGGNAISVLAFSGTAITIPMPENTAVTATVSINAPAGPSVGSNELVDVYISDGMRIQAIGGLLGDTTAQFTSTTTTPMRGPLGISAMVENPASTEPRPDFGLSSTIVTSGHHSVTPLNATLADPKVQTLLATIGQSITQALTPAGLAAVKSVNADVYAVQASGAWISAAHAANTTPPANQANFTMWPLAAASYVRHVKVAGNATAANGALTEEWQRVTTALTATSFTAPSLAPAPSMAAASANSVSWTDNGAPPTWSGYVLSLTQAGRSWQLFNFASGTSLTLPSLPAGVTAPIQAGSNAQASVSEFVLNAGSGFSAASPDLWFWPRMLDQRARSAPLTYLP
ncbi:MAG: carboxypeptidase-like regulatory domain-containing protein [Mariprofundaceae bacterium]|nr:carboxypeptidase-like regulatory domain-containing protein [Mariprofundaceae bacterium]